MGQAVFRVREQVHWEVGPTGDGSLIREPPLSQLGPDGDWQTPLPHRSNSMGSNVSIHFHRHTANISRDQVPSSDPVCISDPLG